MKRSIYLIVLLSLSLSLQAQQTDIVKLHNQATTAKEMEKTALDFSPAVDRRNMKFRDKEADSLKVKVPQRPQRASILRSATDEAASGTCGANGDNVKWTF
ncbi:MAG: hypothetical protein FWD60_11735, partial [Candidatus Azobacteroides sp.]|nr:hypothetical protein [Candidatus Azobacteroides sp.]